MSEIYVGDTVYYAENGVWDTGTVEDIDGEYFEVRWDADNFVDSYTHEQLRKL